MTRLRMIIRRWLGFLRPTFIEPQEDTPWRIPGGRWASFAGWDAGRGSHWDD